jgi:hypothetical protein
VTRWHESKVQERREKKRDKKQIAREAKAAEKTVSGEEAESEIDHAD